MQRLADNSNGLEFRTISGLYDAIAVTRVRTLVSASKNGMNLIIPASDRNFLRLSGFLGQGGSIKLQLLSGSRKLFSVLAQWNIRRVSLLSTRNVMRSWFWMMEASFTCSL
jgi:hypothetical protein